MSNDPSITAGDLSGIIRDALCQLLELAGAADIAADIQGFTRNSLPELLAELMAMRELDVRDKIQRLRHAQMPPSRSALYFFREGCHRRLEAWAQEVTERLVYGRAVDWGYQETPCSLSRIIVVIAMWREYVALRDSIEELSDLFTARRQALAGDQLAHTPWMAIGAAAVDIYAKRVTW